jgi:hypothetical protein
LHALQFPLRKTVYDAAPGNSTHIRFSPSGEAIALIQHPIPGDTAGSVMPTDLNGRATVRSKRLEQRPWIGLVVALLLFCPWKALVP